MRGCGSDFPARISLAYVFETLSALLIVESNFREERQTFRFVKLIRQPRWLKSKPPPIQANSHDALGAVRRSVTGFRRYVRAAPDCPRLLDCDIIPQAVKLVFQYKTRGRSHEMLAARFID
jgi:hypothetical protein